MLPAVPCLPDNMLMADPKFFSSANLNRNLKQVNFPSVIGLFSFSSSCEIHLCVRSISGEDVPGHKCVKSVVTLTITDANF